MRQTNAMYLIPKAVMFATAALLLISFGSFILKHEVLDSPRAKDGSGVFATTVESAADTESARAWVRSVIQSHGNLHAPVVFVPIGIPETTAELLEHDGAVVLRGTDLEDALPSAVLGIGLGDILELCRVYTAEQRDSASSSLSSSSLSESATSASSSASSSSSSSLIPPRCPYYTLLSLALRQRGTVVYSDVTVLTLASIDHVLAKAAAHMIGESAGTSTPHVIVWRLTKDSGRKLSPMLLKLRAALAGKQSAAQILALFKTMLPTILAEATATTTTTTAAASTSRPAADSAATKMTATMSTTAAAVGVQTVPFKIVPAAIVAPESPLAKAMPWLRVMVSWQTSKSEAVCLDCGPEARGLMGVGVDNALWDVWVAIAHKIPEAKGRLAHAETQRHCQTVERKLLKSKFTAVVYSTGRDSMLHNIKRTVELLGGMDECHGIILVWNSKEKDLLENKWIAELSQMFLDKIKIVHPEYVSSIHRYWPYEGIETESVVLIDEHLYLSKDRVLTLYEVRGQVPNVLLGLSALRHDQKQSLDATYVLREASDGHYTFLEPHLQSGSFEMLVNFTCKMHGEIKAFINSHGECADVGFQARIVEGSGLGPLVVGDEQPVVLLGGSQRRWDEIRVHERCLSRLVELHNGAAILPRSSLDLRPYVVNRVNRLIMNPDGSVVSVYHYYAGVYLKSMCAVVFSGMLLYWLVRRPRSAPPTGLHQSMLLN